MLGVPLLFRNFFAIIILSEITVSKKPAFFYRNSRPRPRVIAGHTDVNNRYPYVVTLEEKTGLPMLPFERSCTGSVISSQFVITAAHCLHPRLHHVRCGNMTLPVNESTCISKVLKQFRHPLHVHVPRRLRVIINNDIALLNIEKLVMRSYGRLNFADYKTLMGRAVKYAGFGHTSYVVDSLEEIFKFQKLPLQIGEGVIYKNNDKVVYPQLLIAAKCSNTKQHFYKGDSGGPLFVDDKIVGVGCAISPKIMKTIEHRPPHFMYTPISPYMDWIKHVMTSLE